MIDDEEDFWGLPNIDSEEDTEWVLPEF